MFFSSNTRPPVPLPNTYESLPSLPVPTDNPLAKPESLEYAYADNMVVMAKVNKDNPPQEMAQGSGSDVVVTAGFDVQDDSDDMENNVSYVTSPIHSQSPPKSLSPQSKTAADNPLYGSN